MQLRKDKEKSPANGCECSFYLLLLERAGRRDVRTAGEQLSTYQMLINSFVIKALLQIPALELDSCPLRDMLPPHMLVRH